jgi:hypothetical protein
MISCLCPAHRGASSGDVPRAERDAAPAAAARNRGTGRSRDPTGGHYDPSARSSLDRAVSGLLGRRRSAVLSRRRQNPRKEETWTWKRGPGIRNRRQWSAERRLPADRKAGRTRLASVSGGSRRAAQGVSQAPAFPGAPLPSGGVDCDDGLPGAAKNTGGGALACRAEAQRRRAV